MCHDIMTHAAAFRTGLTMTASTLSTQGTLVTGAHTMMMFLEDNAQLGTAQVVLTRTATTLARPDRSTEAIHGWIHRPFPMSRKHLQILPFLPLHAVAVVVAPAEPQRWPAQAEMTCYCVLTVSVRLYPGRFKAEPAESEWPMCSHSARPPATAQ
jgi:hypothetical protein